MKHRSKFITVFIAAAITFATLMVFAKPYYAKNTNHHGCWQNNKESQNKHDSSQQHY